MTYRHAPTRRLRAAATAFASTLVTLVLLAGVPWVLWQSAGLPWPDHVDSWSELADRLVQPVSDPLLIDLLAMVGWVCWAAFTCTVVQEALWYATHLPQLLRDRNTHHDHLAALSVRSALAALCVGTLIVALLSLWRPQAAGAQQSSSLGEVRPFIAATAPLTPAPVPRARSSTATEAAPNRATRTGLDPVLTGSSRQVETSRHVEYTVVDGDTLWDIARTHMGDALQWPRIYALNKDRVQSDGSRLSDPDLIVPGWQLTVPTARPTAQQTTPPPASAVRARHAATPAPAEKQPAPQTPGPSGSTGRQENGDHAPASQGHRTQDTPRKTDAGRGPAAIGLGTASLIGITAAAGLLAARRYWYLHQNRLRDPDQEADVPALSTLVDRATRAVREAGLPRDPDPLISRRIPPQQPRGVGTVTIGVRDNAEVTLDELAMPGGCVWTGPGAEDAARALLVGILTAAERQRPGPARIRAVVPEQVAGTLLPGLPPQFTALDQPSDTAQAIQAAEQHLITHARTEDEHDLHPDAAEPAPAGSAKETGPGTLLLLTTPDAPHIGQLQALAARSHPGILTVLSLNTTLPGAESWNIAADGTTRADTPEHLTHPLRLFHLTPDAGRDMTDLLLGSHGQRPRPPAPRPPHTQTAAAPEEDEPPAHPHTVDQLPPAQTKPVRLQVLGPITLYARGHPDPIGTNLRHEVHEFLALLAAHPAGLLASDIADKMRLDENSDPNALKNLRRAVRRALRTATGITAQEFILLHGELHKLHPDLVETDLADFTHSLKRAFSATGKEKTDNTPLTAASEALAHYRGPFAQGGDYLWADTIREHLATQATDAALRLARQAEHTGTPHDRDTALAMLEHLNSLHPDHERVVQHAIRLYQSTGRHDAARHAYTRLQRHLAELGVEPEPATQALLALRTHSG